MLKQVAVAAPLALLPLLVTTAHADTQTVTADTLVVVTPNAPIVVTQGQQTLAPPGAAEMPPVPPAASVGGAPQNENWNNVSHINGAVVPVGERGAYLYSFKKTNISGNPFGPFFGYYDLAASHALSQNVAVSVSLAGWSMHNSSSQGYQATASLPIYFRRAYSGPFLEPGVIVRGSTDNYEAYDCYDCSGYDNSSSWAGPELLFGWHWTFDSGLNIAAAFGVAKRMSTDQMDSYDDGNDANGYFRVGYAF